jgi:hypothetical protein
MHEADKLCLGPSNQTALLNVWCIFPPSSLSIENLLLAIGLKQMVTIYGYANSLYAFVLD